MTRMMPRRRGVVAGPLLAVILLIAIMAGIWYFALRSTPERTVSVVLAAVQEGDRDLLDEHLARDSVRWAEEYLSVMSQMMAGDTGDEPPWTVGEARVSGNEATVPVTVRVREGLALLSGSERTIDHVVVLEDGRWKLDVEKTARAAVGGIWERIIGAPAAPPAGSQGRQD